MASLNLSSNGPSLSKSYQSVVNAPNPSTAAASSPTYGQWAIFAVSTPLVSAFQLDSASKESVLKVHSTGEGELIDLIEEFSEGKIQFAFIKVKDPNTGLLKNVLIAWCGEGVPERTKGYFTSHLATVAKFLHSYHIQITARSDRDLTPEGIIKKVADASGAKYVSGDISLPQTATLKPVVATKPVFTPNRTGGIGFKPLAGTRRTIIPKDERVDGDGWGTDAPPVTRTQLEKVPSAYQPTKVNIQELVSRESLDSRANIRSDVSSRSDIVGGGYQPVGKVDIAAIRKQARESGELRDDHPEPVKGMYEPTGRVDIAAIRAKAQKPSSNLSTTKDIQGANKFTNLPDQQVYQTSERLMSLPKPKVSNSFSVTSSFTGTKAPLPGDFVAPSLPTAPVGIASRTFADEGGKTPAQLWAERKVKERNYKDVAIPPTTKGSRSPTQDQPTSGEWKSSYIGRTWAPVQTTYTGKSGDSNLSSQQTGGNRGDEPHEAEDTPASGAVSSIRGMFTNGSRREVPHSPPTLDTSSKPNVGRSVPAPAEEDISSSVIEQSVPSGRRQPPSPPPMRESSPIRVAMPVSNRTPVIPDDQDELSPPPAMPTRPPQSAALEDNSVTELIKETAPANPKATVHHSPKESVRALVQYDYEKAEDNEIELNEGEYVTDIEMLDKDWWSGVNARGERGLFPSNYVEVVDFADDTNLSIPEHEAETRVQDSALESPTAAVAEAAVASIGPTATALYDYEAAEDNEIGFPDGAKIINIEFPDEDWWSGEYEGKGGFFPASYVKLDE